MINQHQQILNLLGLARRAGQLVTGEGIVLTALQKDQVRIVLLASDAGQATIKKVTDKCQTHQVRVVNDFTRLEISQAIGQARTIVGITGAGFAKKIHQLTTKLNEGE
ncbi:YlxQ-related RNA-binding protein [Limosilactobacillus fermentum]|uniref:YlxQ-related RNA-binding protein n=1 Tax=Limosilactobacillus fermentum TaxID=1613 RepID=UPI002F2682CB